MLSPPAASLLTALQAVGVLCAIIAIGRWNRTARMDSGRASALLSNHWSPAIAGLVTFAIVRIVWGSFHEPGIVHDERAYLLQAEIFARGRLRHSSSRCTSSSNRRCSQSTRRRTP